MTHKTEYIKGSQLILGFSGGKKNNNNFNVLRGVLYKLGSKLILWKGNYKGNRGRSFISNSFLPGSE